MKVLLINDRPHQFSLLKNVCDNLLKYGIHSDIFIPDTGKFYSSSNEKCSFLLKGYKYLCKSKFFSILMSKLFYNCLVYLFAAKYDAFDFQGLFVPAYQKMIPKLKNKYRKRIMVTIWGSDFYRHAGGSYQSKIICYEFADLIHISTYEMKNDFLKIYPQYEDKIRVIHFGIGQLEKILTMLNTKDVTKNLPVIIPDEDLVITCGYNGIPAQQHKVIINSLVKLNKEKKRRLFVLIPMTYGTPLNYKKEVESLMASSGLRYHIIDQFITEEQMLYLRIRTNITINIQTTDAFAGSIQEHIMAKNLLIVGDWLPYHKIFEDNNIYAIFTDLDNLFNKINWGIDNYELLGDKLNENSKNIYKFSSWNSVAPFWARIYNELLF